MGTTTCAKEADLPLGAVCPGNFKLNCEDDDGGEDFNGAEDCDVSRGPTVQDRDRSNGPRRRTRTAVFLRSGTLVLMVPKINDVNFKILQIPL